MEAEKESDSLESVKKVVLWLMTTGVGPVATVYCLYYWSKVGPGSYSPSPLVVVLTRLYLHAEMLWWLAMLAAMRLLDARPDRVDASKSRWQVARDGVAKLITELSENAISGHAFLTGWIGAESYEKVTRADVLDWWASVMCQAPFKALPCFEQRVLCSDIEAMERSLGKLSNHEEADDDTKKKALTSAVMRRKKKISTDGQVDEEQVAVAPRRRRRQMMRLNLDSIISRTATKPLWIYATVRGVGGIVAWVLMRRLGFRREKVGNIRFWVKRTEEGEQGPPQLFLHGIGIGLAPYARLLGDIVTSSSQNSAVVVLDMPSVSMTSPANLAWNGGVPDAATHIEAISTMLARVSPCSPGVTPKADIFAHSYGTVVAAWLIKKAPHLVRSATLAEPVSVLIHHCHVAESFLYRAERGDASPSSPSSSSHRSSSSISRASSSSPPLFSFVRALHDRLLRMDPVIVHVLMRNFWWYENTLFIDDIEKSAHPTTIILSECDDYTPSHLIRDRLSARLAKSTDTKVKLVWCEGAEHGDFITSPHLHDQYVDESRKASLRVDDHDAASAAVDAQDDEDRRDLITVTTEDRDNERERPGLKLPAHTLLA